MNPRETQLRARLKRTERMAALSARIREASNAELLYSGALDDDVAELNQLRGTPAPRSVGRLKYAYFWVRRFLGIDGPTEFEQWNQDEVAAGGPRLKKNGRYE